MIWAQQTLAANLLLFSIVGGVSADTKLIVVQDSGGASAAAYYRALNLKIAGSHDERKSQSLPVATPPAVRYQEGDLLPVRSKYLRPGAVNRRVSHTPGLTPLFLIGDDPMSRGWLRERRDSLRALHAVGLVVNVESQSALDALRRLAPGLTLTPASGDDLAERLHLRTYPVLITADTIEQ